MEVSTFEMNNKPETAISLQSVSKSYKLYENPSHRVKEAFHPFRKQYNATFHALKEISLEIGVGETIGIVGRNGCGKSTLLQIVCGIMPPTSGHLHVNGRISAILELGAGFNPEFSGRDNIYLNCSILGMNRSEVDRRIDDILEFADIGQFIEQPVKTYSSGMSIRLAFSIAINIEPAILVVDEALSVGDAAFQRKCFSRIKSIQEQGATIIFVSHDAGAVVELCDRAVLLDQGELICAGSPKEIIALYHKLLFAPQDKVDLVRSEILGMVGVTTTDNLTSEEQLPDIAEAEEPTSKAFFNDQLLSKTITWYEPNGAVISGPHITTIDGRKVNVLVRNEEYFFNYNVLFSKKVFSVRFCMMLKTVTGFELGGYGNYKEEENTEYISEGSSAQVRLRFRCSLLAGAYFLNAGVMGIIAGKDVYLHRGIDVLIFEVMQEGTLAATPVVDFGIVPLVAITGKESK